MEINGRYPIVPVRVEASLEFAYFAPTLKIIVREGALFGCDDFGHFFTEQGKSSFCPYDSDGHIVFIKDKHAAIQARLWISGNHN